MFRFIFIGIFCALPIRAFGAYGVGVDGTCLAGEWKDYGLCQYCTDWGDYTSDGGTGGRESCYTLCDDGTRAYWPNTCDENLCALGAYMNDGLCTVCPGVHYCPGDNTKIDCHTTIHPDYPDIFDIYVLNGGNTYQRDGGRYPSDCLCGWYRDCGDGSCKEYKSYNRCQNGPDSLVRLAPSQCNNGYYATDYKEYLWAFSRCAPCTGLPENATFTGYGTPDENHENGDNCPWKCNDGLGRTAADTCAPLCAAGMTKINTSTGVVVPLFEAANTSPAIHIRNQNGTCHADLIPGTTTNAIHIRYNGVTYHTTNDNK